MPFRLHASRFVEIEYVAAVLRHQSHRHLSKQAAAVPAVPIICISNQCGHQSVIMPRACQLKLAW